MNFNNFTIKSQEAIQKAVEITRSSGSQAVEPVHLLKGVMSEGESLVKFIFRQNRREYRYGHFPSGPRDRIAAQSVRR